MIIRIIMIVHIMLCSYSYAFSQSIEDAINTINNFCELDSAGYRLLEKNDPAEIASYALNYSTDSRNGYNIITGYHILKCLVQGNRAEADVVFYSAASTNPFIVKDQDLWWEKIELRLNDENRWLIVSDVGKPKVSLSAYMAHLNSVLKSKDINEEDINEIERKIELLRNITVIPEKERYQVDPQSKHLDIGLNADEIEIPVDSTMIIDKDMTFDGKPEKIIIRITGETQIAPYSWSISIVDGEKTIFAYRTNTLWNDRNFYQKNYFRGAKSYIDNKRKYYFEYIPENIIRFSSFAHADYVFDRNNVNSAYRMALDQLLKRFSININEAERIAEKILEKIRNGVNYLHIPIGQGNMNPMIYIEEIGTFVVFLGN